MKAFAYTTSFCFPHHQKLNARLSRIATDSTHTNKQLSIERILSVSDFNEKDVRFPFNSSMQKFARYYEVTILIGLYFVLQNASVN